MTIHDKTELLRSMADDDERDAEQAEKDGYPQIAEQLRKLAADKRNRAEAIENEGA
jgi:hypothetical protein